MARIKSASPKIPKHIEKLIKAQEHGLVKIDIGGGNHPQEGFIIMDVRPLPHVHAVHNWDDFPWPFPSSCATIITAVHVVEHVNPANFNFVKWMDECWRILKYDGQLMISTPYAGSPGYWADPTHVNGCTHHTWRYFDPASTDRMYDIYRPKPWKIKNCYWSPDGIMEVLMEKRREDVKR